VVVAATLGLTGSALARNNATQVIDLSAKGVR